MKKLQIILNSQLVNYYKKPARDGNIYLNIIFLHGWRSQGMVWKNIAENDFFNSYNCYLLDLPGFGGSLAPSETFNLAKYGGLIKTFIDKLNLVEVILVGHSFGGRVAVWLSANDNRIVKLIVVDGAGIIANRFKSVIYKIIAIVTKPFFMLPGIKNLRPKVYELIGSEDYLATPELTNTYRNIIADDVKKYLPKIKQPTLLVWGDKDLDTPIRYAEIFKSQIKNSKLAVLTGAGHFSFLDKPQEFCREVENFLN